MLPMRSIVMPESESKPVRALVWLNSDRAALAATPRNPRDLDRREAALKIVVDSVKIHIIRRVEFHTEEYEVSRHRWEKRERKF
jgi:hypothetical protein